MSNVTLRCHCSRGCQWLGTLLLPPMTVMVCNTLTHELYHMDVNYLLSQLLQIVWISASVLEMLEEVGVACGLPDLSFQKLARMDPESSS